MSKLRTNSSSSTVSSAGQPSDSHIAPDRLGNFIAEWFGHRVHPSVMAVPQALADQQSQRCPFLSVATLKHVDCIKSTRAKGVCTISSSSNGPRQDWLVCPHRALDFDLMENAARRLFEVAGDLIVVPAPTLETEDVRERVASMLATGGRVIVFLRSKLGGEISLSSTERSPEVSFDMTMVEILQDASGLAIGKYAILEIQTMDFHGSYERAVQNLTDARRLHPHDFHEMLRRNEGKWISERIEGPNIANVFKRTFYQIMLKFQIGAHESSAGCVLALPASVWDSWQRHLGGPELISRTDGTLELSKPGGLVAAHVPAWIYVFDVDGSSAQTPNPIVVQKIIATDADSVAHYVVKVAPEIAIAAGGAAGMVASAIRRRLGEWWPALAGATVTTRRRRQPRPPASPS